MPSERAKENKTLTSSCAICGKDFSTELLRGRVTGVGRHRRIVPVCESCLDRPLEGTPETPVESEPKNRDSDS